MRRLQVPGFQEQDGTAIRVTGNVIIEKDVDILSGKKQVLQLPGAWALRERVPLHQVRHQLL